MIQHNGGTAGMTVYQFIIILYLLATLINVVRFVMDLLMSTVINNLKTWLVIIYLLRQYITKKIRVFEQVHIYASPVPASNLFNHIHDPNSSNVSCRTY